MKVETPVRRTMARHIDELARGCDGLYVTNEPHETLSGMMACAARLIKFIEAELVNHREPAMSIREALEAVSRK